MARGSIIWRCGACGNMRHRSCKCVPAKYYIVYPIGIRRKWEAVSKSKKDAERILSQRLTEQQQGVFYEVKDEPFSEFSDQWLREFASTRLKISTFRSYKGLINRHLKPYFKDYLLSQISPRDVQRFIATKVSAQKLSARTINYILKVLKMIFKCAKQWKIIRESPAEGISRVRQDQAEMDFLNPDEIVELLKHSEGASRMLFLTAILTGMRRGELLGFQWGDINWKENLICIKRSLFWRLKDEVKEGAVRWIFVTPKSARSVRSVVMSPKLREALLMYRSQCPSSPQNLVFCSKVGTPLDPNNMVKQQFHPALDRAKLRRIRFHDFRHTYAALLIAQGAHAKFIQSQLGHASIQTTLDRYGHLMPQTQVGVGEKLDSQIFEQKAHEIMA